MRWNRGGGGIAAVLFIFPGKPGNTNAVLFSWPGGKGNICSVLITWPGRKGKTNAVLKGKAGEVDGIGMIFYIIAGWRGGLP